MEKNSQSYDGYQLFFKNVYPQLSDKQISEKLWNFTKENMHRVSSDSDVWRILCDSIENPTGNSSVYVRTFGNRNDKCRENLLLEFYKSLFDYDLGIKIDSTNNYGPKKMLRDNTYYIIKTKNKSNKNKIELENYQVSHVFGKTLNCYAFTAPWNVVYLPKIVDPFTGHESEGEITSNFKESFQQFFIREYREQIKHFNEKMELLSDRIREFSENEKVNLVELIKKNNPDLKDPDRVVTMFLDRIKEDFEKIELEKMTKRALISVSDKTGIIEFATKLIALGWEIVSTGGTKIALDNAGLETIAIDDVTGFPEMMDGRVKTLHPKIHGGLLARRDSQNHLDAAKGHEISLIDLVVVNLYPFKETILKPDVTYAEAVENIDIGGPSMLRSAAKNHASVTVIVDPSDYAKVLSELEAESETSYTTRQALAAKVFRHTAAYDALIAEYFTAQVGETKPEKLTLTYDLNQAMRYGENPQQDADFYQKALPTDYSIASAKQLNGKELSFNNIRDADAAIRIIRDFKTNPTVVALKHMNPCGIGQADTIESAWDYAYEADPVSIFGGIVVLNREVDAATAQKMHGVFLEIIIAPSYSAEALTILTTKKKNLRILELPFDAQDASEIEAEYTGVVGGLLVQNQDVIEETPEKWEIVTKRQPSEVEQTALEFAWKAIKYVKSNGIIITNDHMTLGVGPGQTNRVASVRIAIDQAKDRLDGAVLASDAFFPFADNVEEIAKAGIKAIIQPGGSVRDQESIDVADKYGIAMVFTGVRHFRH